MAKFRVIVITKKLSILDADNAAEAETKAKEDKNAKYCGTKSFVKQLR